MYMYIFYIYIYIYIHTLNPEAKIRNLGDISGFLLKDLILSYQNKETVLVAIALYYASLNET